MKLLFVPFLIMLLFGCSSIPSGVNETLYTEGKDIVQMTSDNIDSGKLRFSKEQMMKIDNFTSKYTNEKLSKREAEFYQLVFWTQISYMSYGDEQENKYMNKYHDSVKKLKSKFNIDVN